VRRRRLERVTGLVRPRIGRGATPLRARRLLRGSGHTVDQILDSGVHAREHWGQGSLGRAEGAPLDGAAISAGMRSSWPACISLKALTLKIGLGHQR